MAKADRLFEIGPVHKALNEWLNIRYYVAAPAHDLKKGLMLLVHDETCNLRLAALKLEG